MAGYTVFISSTYEDLIPYRQKVIDFFSGGILNINFIGMEHMPASDIRPIDECKKKVEASDIFILIVGERYGWIPEDNIKNPEKKSITELEYTWARECLERCPEKTILRFIVQSGSTLSRDIELDDLLFQVKQQKLADFKNTIKGDNCIVKGFLNADDLVKQINNALWYKYAGSPFDNRIDEEAVYTCNRTENYIRFKTKLDASNRFNAFIGIGNSDDIIENFFNRIVKYDFNSFPNVIKTLPKKPKTINHEKALAEHIEKIAFEIDPLKRSVLVKNAVTNYCKQCNGNIYFKTDITLLDINEVKDFVHYLLQLFKAIEQQLNELEAVHFYLFIYSDDEQLHRRLETVQCNDLGEFEEVAYEDLKSWLAENYSTDAGLQNLAIENYFLIEENDILELFELRNLTNEARRKQKLSQYRNCYGLDNPRRISYPMNVVNKLMQRFIKKYNRKEI